MVVKFTKFKIEFCLPIIADAFRGNLSPWHPCLYRDTLAVGGFPAVVQFRSSPPPLGAPRLHEDLMCSLLGFHY
jgi:hypothetical protein